MELTKELYEAIITIIDDRVKDIKVTREEFELLRKAVLELAEAQKKAEERLTRLEEAQIRTEERLTRLEEAVERLAEAQAKTEIRLNELAEAQKKTEEELKTLTITVKNVQKELGGLSHSVGFNLENQAYKALPKILKERYGIEIEDRLLRKFIEYPDGKEEEINVYGKGKMNGKEIFIIGESKTHLKVKDIEKFKKRIERIKKVLKGEIFGIFVVHSASPRVTKYAENSGFSVFFSYEF
ncbi:MAG: chordopoxvirus fusion protein [Candidatus Ratteibacteria bacterium]